MDQYLSTLTKWNPVWCFRELDRYSAEEAGLFASESRCDERRRAGRVLPQYVRVDRLAFDADITRSVAFMLNREDGMGISDTFPLKLGLPRRITISPMLRTKKDSWILQNTICSSASRWRISWTS